MSEWNSYSRQASDKIENFILNAKWEDFPLDVQQRAIVCAVDLFDVMIAGAKTHLAQHGIRLAENIFARGNIPVIGTPTRMNLVAATLAYGYNVNALDADDGHNLIKGHPGAVVAAGLLPAALKVGASYKEFLTALVVGYEVAVRAALSVHRYYDFYHGTGSWGSFATAAAIAKIYKLDRKNLSNALGIADYQAPISPIMRIVEIPSMNKDGVAWGAFTGAMAIESAMSGITGEFYNLLEPQFSELVENLGEKYEILDIYFKYFPCCRWAHAPVAGAIHLAKEDKISIDDIETIFIRTFSAATKLSAFAPTTCDEAQYNMIYPVCAAIKEGKFTPVECSEDYLNSNPDVIALMERVKFAVDEELDAQFPTKRYARVEIVKKDGTSVISDICEPWGEKESGVNMEWVRNKFSDTSSHCFTEEDIDKLTSMLSNVDYSAPMVDFITFINKNIF